MSKGIGFQARVSVDDAGTGQAAAGTVTEFAGLAVLTLPGEEVGKAETTDHNQTHPFKTYVPTLIEPGELGIELYANQANMTRVRTLLANRTLKTYKVESPRTAVFGGTTAGQTFEFQGFPTKREPVTFEREGVVMLKFTVQVSGAWTVTAGTSS